MKTSGTILQVMAFISFFGGVVGMVGAIVLGAGIAPALGIFFGAEIWAALLYGVGKLFEIVPDAAADLKRTADALDVLVQRRTGVGTLPPDAAKRLRDQPRPTPRQSS